MNGFRPSDAYRVTLAPSESYPDGPPVSLDYLKEALRINLAVTDEDSFLTVTSRAAEQALNKACSILLRQQEHTAFLSGFPCTHRVDGEVLSMLSFNRNPISTKPTITVEGVALDEEDIILMQSGYRSYVLVKNTDHINADISYMLNSVAITATVGIAEEPDEDEEWLIPPEAITALTRIVAFEYQNREGFDRGRGAEDLIFKIVNEYTVAMGIPLYH